MRRVRATLAAVLFATTVTASGCAVVVPGRAVPGPVAADDRALIRLHVARYNAAGLAGPGTQLAFLRATQEPSTPMPPARCFGAVALQARMVERTLRPAPGRVPVNAAPGSRVPDGALYVAAVGVTALVNGVPVRDDSGSQHFVIRDGEVFGYAPCPD